MDQSGILLRIENQEPIGLASLTRTLSALASDYERMTGRQLSVARAETGSIVLTLLDWAGKLNDLYDFVMNIKSMLGNGASGSRNLKSSRRVGAKSALALAELAIQSHAEVEIYEREPDGREVRVRITPLEARKIRDRQELASPPGRKPRETAPQIAVRAERELEGYAKAVLDRQKVEDEPIDPEHDGLLAIIRVLVDVIRSQPGGEATLQRVASRLRQQGYDPGDLLGV